MNDLLRTLDALYHALAADPLLALAHTVAWLDPVALTEEDDDFMPDDDGTINIALRVLRGAFPDLYAAAIDALRRGADYAALDRLICDGVTGQGIPLDSLEFIGFGVPLPAYGLDLTDADTLAAHPDLAPLLDVFGVRPGPNPYALDVPDCVYTAAQHIAQSLIDHARPDYQRVGWLIAATFGVTGNSVCDLNWEQMSDLQPLSWDADDVAFACEIIAEADQIVADAQAGLAYLSASPDVMIALQENVKQVYEVITTYSSVTNMRICW